MYIMQKRNNVGQVWILQSDLRGKAYNNRYPQRSLLEVRDEGLLRLGDQGIWGIKMRMYQIMQLALTDISLHPKLEFFYQMSIFCDFDPPFIQILHLTAFKSCCSNLFSQIRDGWSAAGQSNVLVQDETGPSFSKAPLQRNGYLFE